MINAAGGYEPRMLNCRELDFIMYLASDKANFITGTNHVIDGGRLLLRG